MVEHSLQFLLTSSAQSTVPLTSESERKLRESDSIERWHECGWACATGFKAGRIHVMVHANSQHDIDYALGLRNKYLWHSFDVTY